jgi:hypothetical protein
MENPNPMLPLLSVLIIALPFAFTLAFMDNDHADNQPLINGVTLTEAEVKELRQEENAREWGEVEVGAVKVQGFGMLWNQRN